MTKTITTDLKLKYFKISEFDSPDEPGSGVNMDPDFLLKIDKAREIAGCKFRINSAYRSQEHNLKVGGRFGSSHKKIPCKAVDIAYNGSRERYLILNALMQVGINRLGLGNTFIHADTDEEKEVDNGQVIWTYKY
jgi:uncharacterized protein YcbK (DUF882 family)